VSGREELAEQVGRAVDHEQLLDILTDHRIAEDHELPDTGVGIDIERLLSSRFIRSPGYGTRACSVVSFWRGQRVEFSEQNYIDAEHAGARVHEEFAIEAARADLPGASRGP
jgi:uncharacterized protein with NRDE domain